MNTRTVCLLSLMTLLVACARQDGADTMSASHSADESASIAPPITAPAESSDPAQPPSYEVSIASAASDHNKALERCAKQPAAVRTQCEQEANAAFAEVESSLKPLRGNQQ
jgi:hypothetical protein